MDKGKTIKLMIGVTNPNLVDVYFYKGWYVQDTGTCVNHTYDIVTEGQHMSDICDNDCFSCDEINSLEELIEEVDER